MQTFPAVTSPLTPPRSTGMEGSKTQVVSSLSHPASGDETRRQVSSQRDLGPVRRVLSPDGRGERGEVGGSTSVTGTVGTDRSTRAPTPQRATVRQCF